MANVVEVIFRGVDQVSRNTSRMNRSLERINRLALRAGAALGVAFSGRAILRATDSMILVENRIRLVTDSVAELNAVQEELFKVAQQTRSAFAPTVELYARVARTTQHLGLTQQEIIDLTRTVNQTIQISGATAQEASAGVIQFAQALASGELRGEELRSVMEQLSGLSLVLARGLGVGIGELRDMAEAGELTAERIIRVLKEQAPQVAAEFQQITPTIEGAFQTIQNSLAQFIDDVGEASGATDGLVDFLQDVSEWIDTFSDAVTGSLEPTDDLTANMKKIAVTAIVAATAVEALVNAAKLIPSLTRDSGEILGGVAAGLNKLAVATSRSPIDLDSRKQALREAAFIFSETFKDGFDDTQASATDFFETFQQNAQSASTRISEILIAAFRDAADEAEDLDDVSLQFFDIDALEAEGAAALAEMHAFFEKLEKENLEALAEAGRRVTESVLTPFERMQATFKRLNTLVDAGAISWETYTRAVKQAQDAFDQATDTAEETFDQLEAIADEAARSMQRAFSDFFFDPFHDGLEGMVAGFLNAIRRMLADQAAVKFFELLFGKKDGGGGLLGDLFKIIFGGGGGGGTGPTGPPLAHGGFTIPGMLHPVNEREPEFLLTNGRSEVVPLSKMAAAGKGGSGIVYSPKTELNLLSQPLTPEQIDNLLETREALMFAKFKRMLRDDGID